LTDVCRRSHCGIKFLEEKPQQHQKNAQLVFFAFFSRAGITKQRQGIVKNAYLHDKRQQKTMKG
jgi:tmRNA-binding protein